LSELRSRATLQAGGLSRFHWLLIFTCLTTYALVVLGGVVRTTGSGDACPDWPRCHGELIPPLETQILIEFSHRLLASVVGFLVLASAIAAWRAQRSRPFVVWGALAAVGLVIGQVILGGVTVLSELSAGVVMGHLAMAGALLATLIVVTLAALPADARPPVPEAAAFRTLAAIGALAVFGLMLTGSYVSGSGAGLAFRDWPLFDGRLMPDGGRLAMIHATHRFAALVFGLLLAYVALRAWRLRAAQPAVAFVAMAALSLYAAQAFVGAANIWTLLQPAAAAAHLALAMAIWALLVVATALAHASAAPVRQRAADVSRPQEAAIAARAVAAQEPS
jgi:heme A synthase